MVDVGRSMNEIYQITVNSILSRVSTYQSGEIDDIKRFIKKMGIRHMTEADYAYVRAKIKRHIQVADDKYVKQAPIRELICELDCVLDVLSSC